MRDCTEMFNESGEHIATIGFNESYGLWQIVVVQRKEIEFFCPSKEIALAAWHDEFDPETGYAIGFTRPLRCLTLVCPWGVSVLCNF